MAVVFVVVSVAIFLCPLFIQSPCLIEKRKLPEKPKLIGHRGAPMVSNVITDNTLKIQETAGSKETRLERIVMVNALLL